MALPPAESPSTIKISEFSGLRLEQSANFPGKVKPSKAPFLRTDSLATRAAFLAFAASTHCPIIASASRGFSSKKINKLSDKTVSTAFLTSGFPSFALVCPSNCGSEIFTEMMDVKPSRTSSPVKFLSFSFKIVFSLA